MRNGINSCLKTITPYQERQYILYNTGIHCLQTATFSNFDRFYLITNSQFGFRSGWSTTTAFIEIINETLDAFENREAVALFLLNLS